MPAAVSGLPVVLDEMVVRLKAQDRTDRFGPPTRQVKHSGSTVWPRQCASVYEARTYKTGWCERRNPVCQRVGSCEVLKCVIGRR
ncbi:hypothetical protein GCM10008955_39550 [Deinococcus malanensis]|uniref:Transposase DDE domain-containing protein n=1 Tax=Deinococcus malanensis TaxID=1706855 RepID=A0ABQ2F285_9DEIO|nr:hypothetical protein GCM10008955_39550 [Deinococcus malanensis]